MGDKEKVMKTWDKVTFKWDLRMGLPTGVLMNGRIDLKVIDPKVFDYEAKKKVHGIFGMEAVSLPHEDREPRRGEMTLEINGCTCSTYAPVKEAIVRLLRKEMKRRVKNLSRSFRNEPQVIGPEGNGWTHNEFIIRFVMENGEQFCHYVMDLGEAVFAALGIHDERGFHLADFSITRDSFVKMDGAWITFPHWLRIEHRLPVQGPEDRGY